MATDTQNGHMSDNHAAFNSGAQSSGTAFLGHAFHAATKRSQIKAVLSRLDLDWEAAILALKTSLAPAVLVCLIESTTWINHFTTNSYLAPIIATCALPTLPRAKLIDYNFQLALALAVVYCYSLLTGWCGVQARKDTTSSREELKDYNSSAEAVVAIFLIFIEWLVFTLKSAFPVWQLQCVMAGIYCVAVLPPTARAPDMATVIDITSVSIEVFLAGQAAGFVVGLFIFPQNCRTIFINDLRKCLQGLTSTMRAQMVCMNDLMANKISTSGEEERDLSVNRLNATVKSFITMVTKARSGLDSAGRELAWSQLDQPVLEKLGLLLVDMVVPLSGMTSAADMTQMVISENIPWSRYKAADEVSHAPASDSAQDDEHRRQIEMSMHHHSTELCNAIIEGVNHALLRLKSEGSRPMIGHFKRRKEDVETPTSSMSAGEASFLSSYRKVLDKLCCLGSGERDRTQVTITDHFIRAKPKDLEEMTHEQYKELLRYFLILHVQGLLTSIGHELQRLLLLIEENHTKPKRLIAPQIGKFQDWLKPLFGLRNASTEYSSTSAYLDNSKGVHLGSAFYYRKNPDHLPPRNFAESAGDKIRWIGALFNTKHAAFGVRGACAIMTTGIISFLRQSQEFFFRERFLWGQFAVLLSMSRTAGASTSALLLRFFGTVASMIASYIIWYIVDEKTPGILVFLWLWLWVLGIFFVKFPRFAGAWFVALIAAIVMSANELQVRKLGKTEVAALGQAIYAPYIIFPFRLAVVTLGILIGYFWTIFPFPMSEHSQLRQDVASSMYILANYYMTVKQTILARLSGIEGDSEDPASPGAHLFNARRRLFRKNQALSSRARAGLQFFDWEFAIGGRFPKKTYVEILTITEKLSNYMALAGYVSKSLSSSGSTMASWFMDDEMLSAQGHLCPRGIATRLIVLHSSLSRAHPLPPELQELDIPDLNDFLSRKVPTEEFAAAALIHTMNWYMIRDLNILTGLVRDLVGELDFSFTVDPQNLVPTMTATDSVLDEDTYELGYAETVF